MNRFRPTVDPTKPAFGVVLQTLIPVSSVLQDIECLASDGMLLASCCLAGQIRVWDAQTGDCLTVIPNNG